MAIEKRGNPYRCKICGALANKTGYCKNHKAPPLPKCRISGCNEDVCTVRGEPTELCKRHFWGEDLPLVRESFITDRNFGMRQNTTPGAIPIQGSLDRRRIEGWS